MRAENRHRRHTAGLLAIARRHPLLFLKLTREYGRCGASDQQIQAARRGHFRNRFLESGHGTEVVGNQAASAAGLQCNSFASEVEEALPLCHAQSGDQELDPPDFGS